MSRRLAYIGSFRGTLLFIKMLLEYKMLHFCYKHELKITLKMMVIELFWQIEL